jgi:hypothetical protein
MSTKPAGHRTPLRYLTVMSVVMIVVGLGGFVTTLAFTIPKHTEVTSALRSRGVHTQAKVTECGQPLHDENGSELSVTCRVRFTPAGGRAVESALAFTTRQVGDGTSLAVVYDPEDTGTVALPSDLGYWKSLTRNSADVLILIISAVMVPLGIAGLALRRLFGSFARRYAAGLAES